MSYVAFRPPTDLFGPDFGQKPETTLLALSWEESELGNIGSQVAKRLEAFGCIISYNSRRKKPPSVPFAYYANIYDLAMNSEVLMVCCALTEETHHIVNKEVMAALGKEGVIINVRRGALIDEKEMVQFLVRGEIGGVGLDVFENGPDVPKELFQLDNVVLSTCLLILLLPPQNALMLRRS